MVVDIFCRTYDGDAKWLAKTLPTWIEHCTWVRKIIVSGIDSECTDVKGVCADNEVDFVADDESAEITDGYINQQYTKMRADLFTDADMVMFIDSDTVCRGLSVRDDLSTNGVPDLLHSSWDRVGDAMCWRAPTQQWIGRTPPYEFMRRFPLLYHTDTLRQCREYISKTNGKTLLDIMKGAKSVSEFNLIGAYAWEFEHDRYHWVDADTSDLKLNPFRQYWSHGGVDQLDD